MEKNQATKEQWLEQIIKMEEEINLWKTIPMLTNKHYTMLNKKLKEIKLTKERILDLYQ